MKESLYNLLHQHGAISDFNVIATIINDNEAIVVNSLQREDWPRTVQVNLV